MWEEVMDTEMNNCALIENWGYGIIGQEFNKKHLDLSNSIVPPSNSASQVSKADEHNISLKDNSNELSQISSNDETSLNNNIMPNFKIALQDWSNSQ